MILPTSKLRNYHRNPRRGNVALISESLTEFGQYRSIVVNEGTLTGRPYEVLVGNHTLKAAKANGLKELNCKVIDVDEETAAKIVLADNRTSDMGTYDDKALLELLEGLDTTTGTGFTDNDIDDLIVSSEPAVDFDQFVNETRFDDSTMRAMYVTFNLEEYVAVQARLDILMKDMGLTSSAAVVAALARKAVEEL